MTRILVRRYAAGLAAAIGALAAAVSLSADTAPSVKFTVPVGATPLTVAVNVTVAPATEGLPLVARLIVEVVELIV